MGEYAVLDVDPERLQRISGSSRLYVDYFLRLLL